jgi:ABC-type hemin transport system substrate-binding protein
VNRRASIVLGFGGFARAFAALLMLMALMLAVPACSREPSVALPPSSPAQPRIAALSPAVAIILTDLGHADHIVARHAYDYVLPPAIPAAGDQAGIDYEALLRANPTHVFTQWGARQVPSRLTSLARDRNWILRDVNPLSLEDIAAATLTLDAALHAQPRPLAHDLATKVRDLATPPARAENARTAPRVLLLVNLSPATALGPGSCHHEILLGTGARSALSEGLAFQDLTAEDLVRLAPDAIIWFRPRSPDSMNPTGASDATTSPESDPWQPIRPLNLPAQTSYQLAIIDDPVCLMPSTAMIPVGNQLREIITSWAPPQ